MTASTVQEASAPFLAAAEPQLFVADIKASCDFYTEKLGFKVRFVYGDPPFYGQVFRDAARLNLRRVDNPIFDARLRVSAHLLSATSVLDNSKPLFLEYQASGAPSIRP
jgi:catechol 2,3-dioxygenase-like lactoylglutathione lyase family enzyme